MAPQIYQEPIAGTAPSSSAALSLVPPIQLKCPARSIILHIGIEIVNVRQSAWHGKLQEPKTVNAARTFAVSSRLLNHIRGILQAWRPNTQQLVFATRTGTPWDANLLVKRKFRPMLKTLGIQECGLHAFRHANASLMDELSVPMKVRQQRLGHSDPRLTMNTYTHMASSDDERIAEQLGEILDAVGQNAVEITKGKGPASQQALVN